MSTAFIPTLPTHPLRPSRITTCKRPHLTPQHRRTTPCRPVMTTRPPSPSQEADHTLSLTLLGLFLTLPQPAEAVPESLVEAFKSIPASLAHPTLMWILFGTCIYTFYLGYQQRRLRTSPPEDRELRQAMAKAKYGSRHFQISSILFTTMTIATFSGMANTYTRTGKLFPGPHLYVGLGLVALMSFMASFVPNMLKSKEWARDVHFGLAFVAVSFFAWQAKTGMDIVAKLLKW